MKILKVKIHRIIILLVVLYGCETWSLTMGKERRLRVVEDRVLMRIFGRKMDELTGECRRLYNEELNDLYSSPNIFRVIELRRISWARYVARVGRVEAYTGFCGETSGNETTCMTQA
jgi:hypothetical protein